MILFPLWDIQREVREINRKVDGLALDRAQLGRIENKLDSLNAKFDSLDQFMRQQFLGSMADRAAEPTFQSSVLDE
jgi:hypothetical protein